MTPRIRPALPADVDAVRGCVHAAFSPYIARIGRPPAPMALDFAAQVRGGHVWVAEDAAGHVAGALVQYDTPEGFYIDTVAVQPALRGTGVGRALLQFAEAEALRRGFGSLWLRTNSKMTENQALYLRVGYVETAREHMAGYDRISYRKTLARCG